jgi:hypothetical protein
MTLTTRLVAGLLGAVAAAAVALPVAHADPADQCDTTVGDSVDAYLTRHPDVKQKLTHRGQQESPGSSDPLLDYLNRHPDVRQALITLSQQCV